MLELVDGPKIIQMDGYSPQLVASLLHERLELTPTSGIRIRMTTRGIYICGTSWEEGKLVNIVTLDGGRVSIGWRRAVPCADCPSGASDGSRTEYDTFSQGNEHHTNLVTLLHLHKIFRSLVFVMGDNGCDALTLMRNDAGGWEVRESKNDYLIAVISVSDMNITITCKSDRRTDTRTYFCFDSASLFDNYRLQYPALEAFLHTLEILMGGNTPLDLSSLMALNAAVT